MIAAGKNPAKEHMFKPHNACTQNCEQFMQCVGIKVLLVYVIKH